MEPPLSSIPQHIGVYVVIFSVRKPVLIDEYSLSQAMAYPETSQIRFLQFPIEFLQAQDMRPEK